MKTRILHTNVYEKLVKWQAPQEVRRLYPYLLTNTRINISGMFELSDQYIQFETLLTDKELVTAKEWLSKRNKVRFYNGWVFVLNVDEYNTFKNSPKNVKAYENELEKIPEDIKEHFLNNVDTSIDTTIDTSNNQLSIINNHKKREIVKREKKLELSQEEIKHIVDLYNVPVHFVLSKIDDVNNWIDEKPSRGTGRNLKATVKNWVKRDAISIIQKQKGDPTKRGVDATNL